MSEPYNRYANPNYVEKLKRLYSWCLGRPAPPFKLAMIPTNRCIFRCIFCPNSVARSSGRFKAEDELSREDWLDIVRQGLKLGIVEWRILGGGEPLVRRSTTLAIIEEVKRRNKKSDCEIITNGLLFTPEDIKKLVQLKVERIIFSIHAPHAQTQSYLTGMPDAFEKVTKCLLTFKKVKEELGTDKPVIQINMVLTNRNFDQVVAMVEYARRVGCEELAFHPMREYEEIKSQVRKLKLTLKQKTRLRVYMARAKKLAQSYGLLLDLGMVPELQTDGGLIPKFLRARCYEPFYGLLVDPEGKVTHCIPHGMGIEELDLKKMNMEEIWYGDYFAKVRQKILNGIMMKCCLKCGLLDMSEELRTDLGLFIRHGE